jgi:hypothetical protein
MGPPNIPVRESEALEPESSPIIRVENGESTRGAPLCFAAVIRVVDERPGGRT